MATQRPEESRRYLLALPCGTFVAAMTAVGFADSADTWWAYWSFVAGFFAFVASVAYLLGD